MNLMIQPNQICLIVKLYNNRPGLLPDSNDNKTKKTIKPNRPVYSPPPPINIRFIFIFLSDMSFYIVSYLMNNIFFALNHLFYV